MNNKILKSGKLVVFTGSDNNLTNGNTYKINDSLGGDYRFVIDDKGLAYKMKESQISSNFELLEALAKPAFTLAMCDAGELPEIGSKYLNDDNQICNCLGFSVDLRFVIGEMVELFSGSIYPAISVCLIGSISPINDDKLRDTLIHGNAYQFTNVEDNVIHGIYDEDEYYFKGTCVEWSVSTCTNIQPLTLREGR